MKRILLISLIFLNGALFAQPMQKREKPPDREKLKKRIETIKMWKMLDALELTEEQSAKFLPVYNSFESSRDSLETKMRKNMEKLDEAMNEAKFDERKVSAILDSMAENRRKMFDTESAFHENARKILSVEQQARFVIFQRDFIEEIRGLLEMREGPPPERRPEKRK